MLATRARWHCRLLRGPTRRHHRWVAESSTVGSGASGNLALVLPAITGQAERAGVRLTVHIRTLGDNARSSTGALPWDHEVHGPWTLSASLVVQAGSDLALPALRRSMTSRGGYPVCARRAAARGQRERERALHRAG